jgi:Protein of unknown function (DUF3800)
MMVVNGRGAVSVFRRGTPYMSIYFFFDESGNLDFSPNGTPYYCFGVLSTRDPAPLTQALTALRYDMLAEGLELERFHAAEDRQATRDRVFAAITAVGEFDFDCVVIEKRKANPALHRDGHRPFSILHHSSNSHAALQAADYCMWVVHRKWTANDRRSYDLIHPFIRTELDVLRRGSDYFY